MNGRIILHLVIGAALYYAYLRWRGVVGGNPLSPVAIGA